MGLATRLGTVPEGTNQANTPSAVPKLRRRSFFIIAPPQKVNFFLPQWRSRFLRFPNLAHKFPSSPLLFANSVPKRQVCLFKQAASYSFMVFLKRSAQRERSRGRL